MTQCFHGWYANATNNKLIAVEAQVILCIIISIAYSRYEVCTTQPFDQDIRTTTNVSSLM